MGRRVGARTLTLPRRISSSRGGARGEPSAAWAPRLGLDRAALARRRLVGTRFLPRCASPGGGAAGSDAPPAARPTGAARMAFLHDLASLTAGHHDHLVIGPAGCCDRLQAYRGRLQLDRVGRLGTAAPLAPSLARCPSRPIGPPGLTTPSGGAVVASRRPVPGAGLSDGVPVLPPRRLPNGCWGRWPRKSGLGVAACPTARSFPRRAYLRPALPAAASWQAPQPLRSRPGPPGANSTPRSPYAVTAYPSSTGRRLAQAAPRGSSRPHTAADGPPRGSLASARQVLFARLFGRGRFWSGLRPRARRQSHLAWLPWGWPLVVSH